MFISLKKRNAFIKKVSYDIWGHHILYRKISKAINFVRVIQMQNKARFYHYEKQFSFTFKRRIWFRKRKRFKAKFINQRYLKNFYLVFNLEKFRIFWRKARKMQGSIEGNYLTFLEGRIFMLVYRANFVNNLFLIRQLIWKGIFTVNGKRVYHIKDIVRLGDYLGILPKYRKLIRKDLKMRLKQNIIFVRAPKYLFVNYIFLFLIMVHKPKLNQIYYPANWIDPFYIMGYYNPRSR